MSPATKSLPLRCWVEIDLGALERNVRQIRAALPKRLRYVAVVKADAYGHGLQHTTTRLMHAGADMFAVANLSEAAAIREIGPGWPVLVLSTILPEEARHVADADVVVAISSLEEVARFDEVGRDAGRAIPVHLKIDTGMGRLGVWHERAAEVHEAIRAAKNVRLEGVFTHFSSADSDSIYTKLQRKLFVETLKKLQGVNARQLMIHADNSAGLDSLTRNSPFNAVRVGLMQFGVLPGPKSMLGRVRAEPVFSFHTRVGLVKALPRGVAVSYNRTRVLKRDSTVAVLTAGYGDGIPIACSNRAEVLVRGRRCPVLGRVTMDQTVVDVTDVPGVASGDQATLVGKQEGKEITLPEFAAWAESIPYEILCSVTKRVPRVYRTPLGI